MKYLALATVSFPVGTELGLDPAQVANRKYVTRPHPSRKGWVVATTPLQVKAGEHFHFDGELPKSAATAVEAADKAKTKTKAATTTGGEGDGKGGPTAPDANAGDTTNGKTDAQG